METFFVWTVGDVIGLSLMAIAVIGSLVLAAIYWVLGLWWKLKRKLTQKEKKP